MLGTNARENKSTRAVAESVGWPQAAASWSGAATHPNAKDVVKSTFPQL